MERAGRPGGAGLLAALGAARARYGSDAVARILLACEADPAHEVCGVVVAQGDRREAVAVPNAADRFHAASPREHPRTSRDGYVLDPRALLRILRGLDADGGRLLAVWHSHVEASAAFSEQDRADALAGGGPVLPGVEYLVVGIRRGRAAELRAFRFDGRAFVDALESPP